MSRTATGAFRHTLIRRSSFRSLTRRATPCKSARCGLSSQAADTAASRTSAWFCPSASWTFRTACSALRPGRSPSAASSNSASKRASSPSWGAACPTRSRLEGRPQGLSPTPLPFGILTRRTGGGGERWGRNSKRRCGPSAPLRMLPCRPPSGRPRRVLPRVVDCVYRQAPTYPRATLCRPGRRTESWARVWPWGRAPRGDAGAVGGSAHATPRSSVSL